MRGAGGMKIRYTVFIQSIQMYISKKGILAAQLLGKTIFQGITRGISSYKAEVPNDMKYKPANFPQY